jgi:tungstate transport system ATP-binding protein
MSLRYKGPRVTTPAHLVLPMILDGLRFIAGGRTIVDGLNANIVSRGVTAIVGPNGAGKSITLRLIDGLLPLSSGSIRFGVDGRTEVRRAFVFQRVGLVRASIAYNLGLALKPFKLSSSIKATLISEALAAVRLSDRAEETATHLSGGEMQRLALARAMVVEPDLLLLDEPTANLDPLATEDVERLIIAMAERGTKVLLVSHNLGQVARLASDVLVMANGTVVEHGPTRQILTAPQHPETIRHLNGELPWLPLDPAS